MKTINCNRCGEEIPYVPSYMNAYKDGKLPSGIMVTFWDPFNQQLREVDLCDSCKEKVQDYIFNYRLNNDD